MSRLGTCSSCGGFIPAASACCPNCAAVPSPRTRLLWEVAWRLGGAVAAVTLAACYGPAGGFDCDRHPALCSPPDLVSTPAEPKDLSPTPDLESSMDANTSDGSQRD